MVNGSYAEAESTARVCLGNADAADTSAGPNTGELLDLLTEALVKGGKGARPEALEMATRALAIKERLFGPDHPQVAVSLTGLGEVNRSLRQYSKAKSLYERALAIREKSLGAESPEAATSLNDVAKSFRDLKDTPSSLPLFERALAIREHALGPDHPDVATSASNLGNVLRDLGQMGRALDLQRRAVSIREKAFGPDHPNTIRSLFNLSITLRNAGDYSGARAALENLLPRAARALGPGHPDVANYENSLAATLYSMADYNAARSHYDHVLVMTQDALGADDEQCAYVRNNLGLVLMALGDYAGARTQFEQAIAIDEHSSGPESLDLAGHLNNLGMLLVEAGDPASARAVHERGLLMAEKLQPEGSDVSILLQALAQDLRVSGDSAARSICERGLALTEKLYGPDHEKMAFALSQLAVIQADFGDPTTALPLLERSIAIRTKALGSNHPLVVQDLAEYAQILVRLNRLEEAIEPALKSETDGLNELILTQRSLSERLALRYARKRTSGLSAALAVVARSNPALMENTARVWDAEIRSRAVVLDEMASRHRTERVDADPAVQELRKDLLETRRQLANLWVRGPAGAPLSEYRSVLDSAAVRIESVENRLLKKSAAFRAENSRGRSGLGEILAALPEQSGLVAYVRYADFNPVSEESEKGGWRAFAPVICYLAFIISGPHGEPAAVPLGPAAPIDSLVGLWRERAGHEPDGRDPVSELEACRAAGRQLRERVWDPIASRLKDCRRVLIVPDGDLNLLSFAALPDTSGRFLVETGPMFHVLSAERDLLPAPPEGSPGGAFLAIGDPDFDKSAVSEPGPGESGESAIFRGERSNCIELNALQWKRLPGSGREVEEAISIWRRASRLPGAPFTSETPDPDHQSLMLTGSKATEGAFKRLAPGRRIVHIATHGFFLAGQCNDTEGTRGVAGLVSKPRHSYPVSVFSGDASPPSPDLLQDPVNPLLLSGLVLAGANNHDATRGPGGLDAQPAANRPEDGILTAEEIATLDLTSVEWAVLSGCDTGLGDVQAGEGVFGLRRAFKIAGARTLIMSLWPIKDRLTRDWMRSLYEARFLRGLDTAASVREASLAVLDTRRRNGESTHPFYWASFIAAGDWR